MMRLYVIVEGQTEEEFIRSVLAPYLFREAGIYDVRPIKIATSKFQKGGLVDFVRFQNLAMRLLASDEDALVTSFVDYYGIPNTFPKYASAKAQRDPIQSVAHIEEGISEEIPFDRFIPYIQLHEFEGLLFSSVKGFEALSEVSPGNLNALCGIVADYSNPELINDDPRTAPSMRLKNFINGYRKPLYSNYIALTNGIEVVLERCPRFRTWTERLISRMKE